MPRTRNPDIVEQDLAMAMRRVVVSEDRQMAEHGHSLGVARHDDHRLLAVPVGVVLVGLAHEDEELAPRVVGARGPPLPTVDYVFVAVALATAPRRRRPNGWRRCWTAASA